MLHSAWSCQRTFFFQLGLHRSLQGLLWPRQWQTLLAQLLKSIHNVLQNPKNQMKDCFLGNPSGATSAAATGSELLNCQHGQWLETPLNPLRTARSWLYLLCGLQQAFGWLHWISLGRYWNGDKDKLEKWMGDKTTACTIRVPSRVHGIRAIHS